MVHLITKANSVALLLFHVEHIPGSRWFWRWRPVGDYPAAYLQWREGHSDSPRVVCHCEISGCMIEAEWRPSADAPWRQAALREAAMGSADFRIFARKTFHAPSGFRAFAEVAGMVACYAFGPIELHAGIETTINGRADGPYADNVLLLPGEFVSEDALVRIENLSSSQGSFMPHGDCPPRLTVAPGSAERRYFVHRPAATSGIPSMKTLLTPL